MKRVTVVSGIGAVVIFVGAIAAGVLIGLAIRDAQSEARASTGGLADRSVRAAVADGPFTCLRALHPDGSAEWYCGSTIKVPAGMRVTAPSIPACRSDDGSGPLPCRWNAHTQGAVGSDGQRHGLSFTVLPSGSPVNGVQRVIFRYDDGVSVYTTVPAA